MKKYFKSLLMIFLLFSCASADIPAEPEVSFVLPELIPLREEVVEVDPAELEKPKTFIIGVIVEIEVINGEQRYLYIKTSKEGQGMPLGTIGEIFEDESMAKQVGKFKIIEEFPGYYHGEVTELFYTAKIDQPIRIEVKE